MFEDEPEGADLTSVSVVIEEDDMVRSIYRMYFEAVLLKMHHMNNFEFPTQIDNNDRIISRELIITASQALISTHITSLSNFFRFFDSFFVLSDRKGWILNLCMEKVILTLVEETYTPIRCKKNR